jgi:large subunit ribosomal protein L5
VSSADQSVKDTTEKNIPRLKEKFNSSIKNDLMSSLGLKNIMQVPTLDKIVLNMGVGKATMQQSLIDGAVRDMTVISGQKPVVTRAKASISQFKLRQGMPIGVKVTLRSARMWEFYDRLVAVAIPRIRDFRGLSRKSFDGHGNYTFGITEQIIFPEINYDAIDSIRGMDITIVTTAKDDNSGRLLLEALGFPFRREGKQN